MSFVDKKDAGLKTLRRNGLQRLCGVQMVQTPKQSKTSLPIQLSVRSFVYKDAKIIGAENHHTTWEAILTIIADDCLM